MFFHISLCIPPLLSSLSTITKSNVHNTCQHATLHKWFPVSLQRTKRHVLKDVS